MFYILLPIFLFITWKNIDYMTGIFVLNAVGIYLFLHNIKIDMEKRIRRSAVAMSYKNISI